MTTNPAILNVENDRNYDANIRLYDLNDDPAFEIIRNYSLGVVEFTLLSYLRRYGPKTELELQDYIFYVDEQGLTSLRRLAQGGLVVRRHNDHGDASFVYRATKKGAALSEKIDDDIDGPFANPRQHRS